LSRREGSQVGRGRWTAGRQKFLRLRCGGTVIGGTLRLVSGANGGCNSQGLKILRIAFGTTKGEGGGKKELAVYLA